MSLEKTISKINNEIISTFAELDAWCDHDVGSININGDLRTPSQILEQVSLTNHHLLSRIEKGCDDALRKVEAEGGLSFPENYSLECDELLAMLNLEISVTPSAGKVSEKEIRRTLRDQLFRCLCVLDSLRGGEGIVYNVSMSVNNPGKPDLYQCLYLLTLHIRQYLVQLEKYAVAN